MKIGIAGSDGNILCQLDAVREGLRSLGHEPVKWDDPDASFVFVGNPPFDKYLDLCKSKPVIFNILDLAPHCKEHEQIVETLRTQLPHASKVSAISETVASQVSELFGVKVGVIYYPMKSVQPPTERKSYDVKVAMVGRTSDPNKRCGAAVVSLIRAGFSQEQVAIVGPEYPGWGVRYGVLSDEELNQMYQSVDYVMMMSKEEGIGLPAIEAACAGAIPIVLPDLSTYNEFWAGSPMGPYYSTFTSIDAVSKFLIYMETYKSERELIRENMLHYSNIFLKKKFDRIEVASRIINLYHEIPR